MSATDQADQNQPAFPFQCQGPTTGLEIYYGMTLRDYFAGQALSSLRIGDWSTDSHAATWCYQMADAMMKARQK